jgi:hypothetical protein
MTSRLSVPSLRAVSILAGPADRAHDESLNNSDRPAGWKFRRWTPQLTHTTSVTCDGSAPSSPMTLSSMMTRRS